MTDQFPAEPLLKPIPGRIREFPAVWFFAVWFLLAIAATVPFWLGDLDLQFAGHFALPSQDAGISSWPHENDLLWRFFYRAAPILVGILGLGGLSMAFAGLVHERWLYLRPMGLYLLLTVALGPGLLVNALGKEYAGRPRPRQLINFGGELPYLPPFKFGKPGEGKSFPCGHCSVGFSFAALWLLLRRRNLWLGRAALLGGGALGFAMGVGRMAAGGHFFSDVLWAGLLTMLAAGISYYYIMRMPARWIAWAAGAAGTGGKAAAATRTKAQKAREGLIFGILGGLLIFCLLLASPVHEDFDYQRQDAGDKPAIVILEVSAATTRLTLTSGDAPAIDVNARIRGFGLPSNKVKLRGSLEKVKGTPEITIQLLRKGLYTDYEGTLEVRINTDKIRRLEIEQADGEIILPKTISPTLKVDTEAVSPSVKRLAE